MTSVAPWAVFPRKRLEISYTDYAHGLWQCAAAREEDRAALTHSIERFWAPEGGGFCCLSVRTAFDLYLRALALPQGTEILMTAVTIKDMVRIAEHHGLSVVALDLDPDTLTLDPELIRAAAPRDGKARILLVAHLFGTITDLSGVARACREQGVLLLEDCAEAYAGPSYRGHPAADATFFSFGTIKTSTALGGCLCRIRDPSVLSRMRGVHESAREYPVRPRRVFAQRLVKYGAYNLASSPALFGLAVAAARAAGADHDAWITDNSRGFPADGQAFYALIRQKPSVPLLALLRRRLKTFDRGFLQARKRRGAAAARFLRTVPGLSCPGGAAAEHTYWLFPVIVGAGADLGAVCARMLEAGFDVTPGATQLGCVTAYASSEAQARPKFRRFFPANMHAMMPRVVYLPLQPLMPRWSVRRMLRAMADAVRAGGAPALAGPTANTDQADGALEARFEAAVARSRSLDSASHDEMLKLYGLFKQARCGPCKGARPGALQLRARAKHDAWAALGNISRAEAMRAYVTAVGALGGAATDDTWAGPRSKL
jgi:dTDP-4-amino-4,6-dideoxygalactose transaminase